MWRHWVFNLVLELLSGDDPPGLGDIIPAQGAAHRGPDAQRQMPYLGIIDTANAKHCDLIVMASHGRKGVSAFMLGSETVKVPTHSRIPVLVCH